MQLTMMGKTPSICLCNLRSPILERRTPPLSRCNVLHISISLGGGGVALTGGLSKEVTPYENSATLPSPSLLNLSTYFFEIRVEMDQRITAVYLRITALYLTVTRSDKTGASCRNLSSV